MTKSVLSVGYTVAVVLLSATVLRAATAPIVADVQIIEAGPDSWLVRVSASDNQAFDVIPQTRRTKFVVRLHHAKLAKSRAPIAPAPFGRVTLSSTTRGVNVTLTLVNSSYKVEASQGATPSVVDVRITKE